MKGFLPRWAALAVVVLFAVSCETTGDSGSPLEITEARWDAGSSGEDIVARGKWVTGISTPPTCSLLKGSEREVVIRGSAASVEGATFSKSFTPPENEQGSYHIRCSVTIDPGKTVSKTRPVKGGPNSA
jgi:hypothetical protein